VLQRALITVLLGALAALAALATGVPAHAQDEANSLQSIEPANGATLDQSPTAIVLSFNQELRSDDRPIVVLACGSPSEAQDTGSPEVDADGLVVTIPINTPVPSGACTVSWRLADAAGETILQDFTTFRVEGDPAAATTVPPTQPFGVTTTSPFISITPTQNSSSNPEPVNQGSNGGALWLGRLLSTIGILALFGGLALIAIGWPEGPEYVVTVRYLRAVWIMALVGTVLYLIAYAAKYHDSSFGAAMNPSDWLDLKDDGWPGRAALLRLGFVLGSGWAAMRPERIIDPATAMWAWAIPGGALIAVALSRVDGPLPWLGVGIGFLHVLGSAVWFGGVAIVARVVLAGPGEEDLLHATRAFSRMSTKAMVLVVITGLAQMVRLDGNPFGSSHGQVVLLKVVAVAAMIAVGLEARRQVGYRLDRAHEMTVGLADRFRRAFGAETAIGVVVLAFSGWLLSLEPAKVDKFADEQYTREIAFVDPSSGIDARVFIGPAEVGRNGFRIEVNAPQEGITSLGLRFYPPVETGSEVIFQPLALTTAGTLVLPTDKGIPFAVPGTWTLELSGSTALGTQPGARFTFLVNPTDGTEITTPGSTASTPPVQVSVVDQATTSAPFVTTAPPTPPPTTAP
jgi:putative copper export protein/methionine-rich copper-binding protein CopC